MKKIRLSDPRTGIACLLGDALIAAVTVYLLTRPAGVGSMIFYAVACAIVLALLAFCTAAVFTAHISVQPGSRQFTARIALSKTAYDASAAAVVCTREVRLMQNATRVISVLDAAGTELFSIPTMLTGNDGARSEIPAKLLAQALGVAFRPTVDVALYDAKARNKRARALREARQANRVKRSAGARLDQAAQVKAQQHASPSAQSAAAPDDDINYDELDDLK